MVPFPDDLAACTGFQWDAGNAGKNWELHQVSNAECEQVFFNRPLRVAPDEKHSPQEPRRTALGQTNAGRLLSVVFTVRAIWSHETAKRTPGSLWAMRATVAPLASAPAVTSCSIIRAITSPISCELLGRAFPANLSRMGRIETWSLARSSTLNPFTNVSEDRIKSAFS